MINWSNSATSLYTSYQISKQMLCVHVRDVATAVASGEEQKLPCSVTELLDNGEQPS